MLGETNITKAAKITKLPSKAANDLLVSFLLF
ncbi:hypothetical protein MHYMCMPSP_00666 [Hyalomma marginatum]|uniref:Uncharacterized protein n=1 Tax=Hyalomma marginatum TaxID=34627 RepID=A0A8S4BZY2_9ACAR|nr:hypothetical protein MHYMCMPASI_00309 [Hyalomma marginatum]CAG7592447.1 hypothetical protein MHYMCMPSP_00666 [Hyalomma marginatum]